MLHRPEYPSSQLVQRYRPPALPRLPGVQPFSECCSYKGGVAQDNSVSARARAALPWLASLPAGVNNFARYHTARHASAEGLAGITVARWLTNLPPHSCPPLSLQCSEPGSVKPPHDDTVEAATIDTPAVKACFANVTQALVDFDAIVTAATDAFAASGDNATAVGPSSALFAPSAFLGLAVHC